jgi:hypothetical protein
MFSNSVKSLIKWINYSLAPLSDLCRAVRLRLGNRDIQANSAQVLGVKGTHVIRAEVTGAEVTGATCNSRVTVAQITRAGHSLLFTLLANRYSATSMYHFAIVWAL